MGVVHERNSCAEVHMDGMEPDVERLVILGGGPAGLAAAMYGARAGLCPIVVAPLAGGQLLAKGVDVENYPALARTQGSAIIQQMHSQASHFFARRLESVAIAIDVTEWPFTIRLNDSSSIRSQALIVATGASSRSLGVEGEHTYRGAGISSCAACDGPFFQNKRCAVIGGGDTALEEALFLARICSTVTIIHRRGQLRAGHALQQRVRHHTKIQIIWQTKVQEFLGSKGRLSGLVLEDVQTRQSTIQPVEVAFVAARRHRLP